MRGDGTAQHRTVVVNLPSMLFLVIQDLSDVCAGVWLQVWPGPTHYPDFLSVNKTWPWWRDQLRRLWDTVRQAVLITIWSMPF